MNLCLDQGNTRLKAATFLGNRLLHLEENTNEAAVLAQLAKSPPANILISSTKSDNAQFLHQLKQYATLWQLNPELPVPMRNLYHTPKTLGMDRVAAAIGARVLYPDKACLVIDLGTCITFDVIDAQDQFLGGNIAPGLAMRLRAMHDYTAKLPFLEQSDYSATPEAYLGKSTQEAMLNGAVKGILAEIRVMMQHFKQHYPKFATILCGGDATFFANKLKEQIFVNPNLTLIGLNRILNHNVQATF